MSSALASSRLARTVCTNEPASRLRSNHAPGEAATRPPRGKDVGISASILLRARSRRPALLIRWRQFDDFISIARPGGNHLSSWRPRVSTAARFYCCVSSPLRQPGCLSGMIRGTPVRGGDSWSSAARLAEQFPNQRGAVEVVIVWDRPVGPRSPPFQRPGMVWPPPSIRTSSTGTLQPLSFSR